ncbi:hypothetical protein CSUI_008642, partial [Cystoisospora suis]
MNSTDTLVPRERYLSRRSSQTLLPLKRTGGQDLV